MAQLPPHSLLESPAHAIWQLDDEIGVLSDVDDPQ